MAVPIVLAAQLVAPPTQNLPQFTSTPAPSNCDCETPCGALKSTVSVPVNTSLIAKLLGTLNAIGKPYGFAKPPVETELTAWPPKVASPDMVTSPASDEDAKLM